MSRIPVRFVIGLMSLFTAVFLTLPAAASQVNLAGRVADIWPNAIGAVDDAWPNASGAVDDIWPNVVDAVLGDIWPNGPSSDPTVEFLATD